MEDFTMAFPMYAMMSFNYIRVLLIDALLVAAFILVVHMIIFFRKLNGISFYDMRYIVKMIRDEFNEPNGDSKED